MFFHGAVQIVNSPHALVRIDTGKSDEFVRIFADEIEHALVVRLCTVGRFAVTTGDDGLYHM